MNTICKSAIIAGFAYSTFAFATMAESSVQAGPIVSPGRYCMTWDIGGSDCSFTSYAQCVPSDCVRPRCGVLRQNASR